MGFGGGNMHLLLTQYVMIVGIVGYIGVNEAVDRNWLCSSMLKL